MFIHFSFFICLELWKFNGFQCFCNTVFEFLKSEFFASCVEWTQFVLCMSSVCPKFMRINDTSWLIFVWNYWFGHHCIVSSVNNDSFPSETFTMYRLISSNICKRIIWCLFNMSNWGKVGTSFPIVFSKVCIYNIWELMLICIA